MKCIKCRQENINSANYCKKCGYHFSKSEQKIAKSHTLVGKLENIEQAYKVCSLKIITDNIIFKIVSLLIIIALGIFFVMQNGTIVKIKDSKEYNIQYNTKLDEYYLLVNQDETNLNLYIPNKTESFNIKLMDLDNNLIEEDNYKDTDNITLNINGIDDYYLLESFYSDKESSVLKLYVYRVGE